MKFLLMPDGKELPQNFKVDEKEYELWESGKTKISKLANCGDGYLLEWDENNGMMFFAILNKPSKEEIEEISRGGGRFEIGFTELRDCGFATVKFGSLPWGDCTFEPRLYPRIDFPNYEAMPNIGMTLHIILVDPSEGGLIKGIRMIGLGHNFSTKFVEWCEGKEKKREGWTAQKHDEAIREVHNMYSSKKLHELSLFRWKTTEGEGNEKKPASKEDFNK